MGTLITVSATIEPEYVGVSIQDQGVGMSEEAQAQLFRGDSAHTTLGTAKEKGTGLGLMLCKEFVEKHGGTLWVESSEGQGSIFTFTLARAIKTV
jgi:signal transduction histidine kinase